MSPSVDTALWAGLQAHGITEEHLALLLRLLEVQRSGCWVWHYNGGQLTQCDMRLTFSARAEEVARVEEGLWGVRVRS